jgi:hypothetical protein
MGHESAFSRLELLARNFQFRVGRQRSLNLESPTYRHPFLRQHGLLQCTTAGGFSGEIPGELAQMACHGCFEALTPEL